MDFESFNTDDLADKTLRALGFHISTTGYLKETSPHFTDITDLELIAKSAVVENPSQVVTNLDKKMVKKKNKYAAKRKQQLAKLCVHIRSCLSPCPESSSFLLPRLVSAPLPAIIPAPIPGHMPAPMTTPVCCSGSPIISSSCYVPIPAAFAALSLPCHTLIFCRGILVLLFLLLMRAPPLFLESSLIRIFKQSLSDQP